MTLPGQSWRLQYLKKEGPTQASILALASIGANNLMLLWLFGQEEQSWCASFPWGDSPFHLLCKLLVPAVAPGALCSRAKLDTVFAHLLPPKCNCNYKGKNPNVGFLHILKPNCYNHQVIVSDAASSLVSPAGLCPSAAAFFLRTALLHPALWELDGVCCSLG